MLVTLARSAPHQTSKMINSIDEKLLSIYSKYRHWFARPGFKNHSVSTILSLFMTYVFINFSMHPFTLVFLAFCLFSYVIVSYEWRLFFRSRKEGLNNDKNLFFEESAGSFRKTAFYISLVLWVSIGLPKSFENIRNYSDRLKYALRSDFYREAGISILDSVLFSIIFIEIWRILTLSYWTTKKHVTAIIALSLIFSGLRIIGLKTISGHGMF